MLGLTERLNKEVTQNKTMISYMRYYIFMFLTLFFYYIGDILSRLPFYWSAEAYQWVMKLSVDFDDKIGRKIWKD
jgi:hypothetical protein